MTQIKPILTKEAKRKILDENMLPYDPRLAAVINAVEQAVLAGLPKPKPDMFWDANWNERCEESIHNVLAATDADVGTTIEIQRAVSLKNITIKVTGFDEDANEYTYEEIQSD